MGNDEYDDEDDTAPAFKKAEEAEYDFMWTNSENSFY
jgi:hypothetical protein